MSFSTLYAPEESTSRAPTVVLSTKVRYERADSVLLLDVERIVIREEARRPARADRKPIRYFPTLHDGERAGV